MLNDLLAGYLQGSPHKFEDFLVPFYDIEYQFCVYNIQYDAKVVVTICYGSSINVS